LDATFAARLSPDVIGEVTSRIPGIWLGDDAADVDGLRASYRDYLLARLASPRAFLQEALDARA
jgi:hypothetical protein